MSGKVTEKKGQRTPSDKESRVLMGAEGQNVEEHQSERNTSKNYSLEVGS